jgi:hypothetical protein
LKPSKLAQTAPIQKKKGHQTRFAVLCVFMLIGETKVRFGFAGLLLFSTEHMALEDCKHPLDSFNQIKFLRDLASFWFILGLIASFP